MLWWSGTETSLLPSGAALEDKAETSTDNTVWQPGQGDMSCQFQLWPFPCPQVQFKVPVLSLQPETQHTGRATSGHQAGKQQQKQKKLSVPLKMNIYMMGSSQFLCMFGLFHMVTMGWMDKGFLWARIVWEGSARPVEGTWECTCEFSHWAKCYTTQDHFKWENSIGRSEAPFHAHYSCSMHSGIAQNA